MATPVLQVQGLRVTFESYQGRTEALRGISFALNEGEILGIVGESGSGKSVLARAILRQVPWPGRITGGSVCFNGDELLTKPEARMRRLRGQAIALIVSNARAQLNPIVPVGRQMMNVIRAHRKGASEEEARRKVQALIASVGIGDPARVMGTYPHELSGGMCQRILIAMALSNNPKLLLADEPSSGLDVTVQLHVLELMRSLVRDFAAATIIMTRDLGIVAHYCQHVIVLHDGEIIETGDVRSFFAQPQHPYSRELLRKNFAAVGAEVEGGPAQ